MLTKADYTTLAGYWAYYGKPLAPALLYPETTSYVLERNGRILYAIALQKIEGLNGGYVEGLVRDPLRAADPEAMKAVFSYMENQAKSLGCTHLIGSAENTHLANKYAELGYNRSMGLYHVVMKELS
jgi:hypothetical protein